MKRINKFLWTVAIVLMSSSVLLAQDGLLGKSGSIALPSILIGVLFILLLLFFISRYKRCPSDKILVIYGNTGKGSAKCIHGGAAFIIPVLQDYQYLDLSPINIDVDLRGALSKQNIRVNVPSRFTIAISNSDGIMQAAAERLLGKSVQQIKEIATDIIFGQLRLVVATMDIEEINADRDKFLSSVMNNVETELKKIGLTLINVNVTDIQDESGYIEALGKKASAEAINAAKVEVAQENRKGSIGQAQADQEMRTMVAAENSKAEIGEANAAADATKGKNLADIEIADSDAQRRQRVAEANKIAEVAEQTAKALAEKEALLAQKEAELARAEKELAAQRAREIVDAEIEKEKVVLAAQAEAERKREVAKGEASAALVAYQAEAEGLKAVFEAQAEGFAEIVKAANGDPQAAIGLLMIDKIQELATIQAEAIKNIKFDKVTVFDGGNGENVSGFVNGVFKSIPALSDFMEQSGLNLPEYLAKKADLSSDQDHHQSDGVSTDKNEDRPSPKSDENE